MVAKLHAMKAPLVLGLLQVCVGGSHSKQLGRAPMASIASTHCRCRCVKLCAQRASAPHSIRVATHCKQDLPGLAERLLALRALLPGADVSAMAAQAPELLLTTPVRARSCFCAARAHTAGCVRISVAALGARGLKC